jgi:hypothetical protein
VFAFSFFNSLRHQLLGSAAALRHWRFQGFFSKLIAVSEREREREREREDFAEILSERQVSQAI